VLKARIVTYRVVKRFQRGPDRVAEVIEAGPRKFAKYSKAMIDVVAGDDKPVAQPLVGKSHPIYARWQLWDHTRWFDGPQAVGLRR
jgi:hypothetical protein